MKASLSNRIYCNSNRDLLLGGFLLVLELGRPVKKKNHQLCNVQCKVYSVQCTVYSAVQSTFFKQG